MENAKNKKQPEVTEDQLTTLAGKYPIEMLSEDTLKDASVEDCERLITVLRGMNQILIRKAHMVHTVMESKEQAEIHDAKIAGASETDIANMEAAIARRKAKPPAQHLGGSHITKDEAVGVAGATQT